MIRSFSTFAKQTTPASRMGSARASAPWLTSLSKLGIDLSGKKVLRNPTYEELREDEIKFKEVTVSNNGTLIVDTGKYTGRRQVHVPSFLVVLASF